MRVSRQARAFIDERELEWVVNPPVLKNLTLENIGQYRDQHRADYAEDCALALAETGASTREVNLDGVRTLELITNINNSGAILYFFGGAFVAGGPDEDLTVTAPLAKRLEVPVYGPFYPLAPEHPFPAALATGVAAYRALLNEYDADTIAIVGDSAGGNLAVSVTLKVIEQGLASPGCVVAISPASDLGLTGYSATLDHDPTMKPAERWDLVMDAYVGDERRDHPLISPIHATFSVDFPPTLITTGTRDFLLSDCVRLHQIMRKAGVDVSINVWDGMWHVFEHFYGIPEAAWSLGEISTFIGSHIGDNNG